jgi:hypothetical protein
MPYNNPPWTPGMDAEAQEAGRRLQDEKYGGTVDAVGWVRWASEWRMHRANGQSMINALVLVFKAIDAIRAGQQPEPTPPGAYDVPWDPHLDAESKWFSLDLQGLYASHGDNVDILGWFRWSSDYRILRANGYDHWHAFAKIRRDIERIWGIGPAFHVCRRPLDQPRIVNKMWTDASGYRRMLGDSLFNVLRIFRDDPALGIEHLDQSAFYGYQWSREFIYVGGWAGFWDGAEVLPVQCRKWQWGGNVTRPRDVNGVLQYGPTLPAWADWDDLFARWIEEHVKRKMKIQITGGDGQIIFPGESGKEAELEMHRRAARIVRSVDPGAAFIWEGQNEIPMNSREAGSDRDYEHYKRIIAEVKNILPNILTAQGAGLSEEPDRLYASAEGADVVTVHFIRDPFATCLKHTLGSIYWEGKWRAFIRAIVNGEPKAMNAGDPNDGKGDDSYLPSRSAGEMYALHGMAALIGLADVNFTGAAVKLTDFNANVPTYRQLPELMEQWLPEDIATWDHETAGRGAILYFTKDKEFRTTLHGSWDVTPPRAVASWTHYGDVITYGTGRPPQATGFLVGRFA